MACDSKERQEKDFFAQPFVHLVQSSTD